MFVRLCMYVWSCFFVVPVCIRSCFVPTGADSGGRGVVASWGRFDGRGGEGDNFSACRQLLRPLGVRGHNVRRHSFIFLLLLHLVALCVLCVICVGLFC